MVRDQIHKNICGKANRLGDWFCEKTGKLDYPIYSSYDIRDAGYKITNVDANIYPAGFNNICHLDKETAPGLFAEYLEKHYGTALKRIMLVTEEHTNNPYYLENVYTIRSLLEGAGKKVLLAVPQHLEKPLQLQSSSGHLLDIHSAYENSFDVKNFMPELIISNNDFSNAYEEWAVTVTLPVNPPRELGWYQRQKSRYFKFYNQLVEEFSQVAGIDPFLMNVKTELFENFDIADDQSKVKLADQVDAMIQSLREDYSRRGITTEPFVFVKNNAGTYGLAVIRVGSGQEVREWSYKSRKKMKAAKGGRDVEEVIIQEGIPSRVQSDGAAAEPVIYMVGCNLAGGFLRTHGEKNATESLNSPGAVYKRLCVSDLNVSIEGSPLENVYGWSARLGLLAIALEAQEMGAKFQGYQQSPCV